MEHPNVHFQIDGKSEIWFETIPFLLWLDDIINLKYRTSKMEHPNFGSK